MRPFQQGDWVGLHRAYGDADVMRWLGVPPADLETTAFAVGRMVARWDVLGYGMFAVERRETGEMIGRVGLMLHVDWPVDEHKVEVGWTLQRSAWGHGYATEAALASLAFGFDRVGLERIFSMTDPANVRSRGVMERCGLTLRGEVEYHGHRQVHYAIDRAAWPPPGVELPAIRIVDA
jgi:RimJ/RimL family protein N-acetyltransferase